MSKPKSSLAGVLTAALLTLAALSPAAASAAPGPVWKLSATSQPTNFISGSSGRAHYILVATNVGAAITTGEEITITDTLPAGVLAVEPGTFSKDPASAKFSCTVVAQTVTCKGAGPVHPGYPLWADIPVNVTAPDGSVLTNEAEVSGGGALPAKATTQTKVSAQTPEFDFLPGEEGFRVPIIGEEGAAATQAGSHPYEGIVDLNFPTVGPGGFLTSAGHLRDATIEFPPGLLADPAATPTRCTEAELTSEDNPGCPDSSQIGTVTITTFVLAIQPEPTPLFNMVPPPGAPAALGFNALGVGIFPHVVASIRTESDYGATGRAKGILARGLNPILDVSTELWGDPAAKAHDFARGDCLFAAAGPPPCPVDPQPDSFLSLPVACPGEPTLYSALADSWEEPFPQFQEREATYESADLQGNPVEVGGCNQLQFKPTITAQPTTSVTESPAGIDVDLHQPQDSRLGSLSTAQLKDVALSLPKGLEINASQANGLAACDSAQIGTLTPVGESPASFTAKPANCPDASKLGTVEVTSPLLAQYDAEGKVQRDTQGNVIPEALHGSVFIAKPFDNPFKSLLAIYLTVEDPQTGTFAKLAGEVQADPVSGQLSTRFEENPQLPLQDAKVHLFTGPKAPLQTPGTCDTFTTTTEMVPWSAPETPNASPGDSFATTAAPGGGTCPATAAQAPNTQSFSAGTENPQAGAFSPLIAKLSRADGTQRMAKLETTFPPGLSGKLAGIGQCSDAQIAAAAARSKPNEGALELASPSCPKSSEVGITNVAAGAGPTPFHIEGHLYLAGPYKGAPLSFVAITPAIAGPFDLGSVVVRIAAYLDPVTAQVRAVSDPFPQILQGIPVDVRSVAVKANRPNFTLNPTSCEPKSFTGSVTSALGQVAPLSDVFQVGGCAALPYKPKLTARLFGPIHRGGHPSFRSVFTARPGDANTGRIVFALPSSEFIDQAHFRTICTRVQFAASQCPAGSVYGHVKATSPLVDYPVEGPIYLRSSSHELPDVVAVLKGPPSQPIEVDLDGRVDSVNGGIRTTFETVPDLPVTKAIVTLQGAKKGLFQNSTNICQGTHRANAKLSAQSAKVITLHPKMQADCPKPKKKKGAGKR
jgi:hypothetical protein